MNYEIQEIEELTGNRTTIYSVFIGDKDDKTLYDHFVEENKKGYRAEVRSINNRLKIIGNQTGARFNFFKEHEGKPGDGICALYDDPNGKLRLYCIRYGTSAIILGGGGPKPHGIISWQDDKKLTEEAERLIKLSKIISKRIQEGDLRWSIDGTYLIGDLNFTDYDGE